MGLCRASYEGFCVLHEDEDRDGGLLGGLEDDGVAAGEGRGELPRRHEEREVPREDLPDDAERPGVVVGDGVAVELGELVLLRADERREVAEVVGREGNAGAERFAARPLWSTRRR